MPEAVLEFAATFLNSMYLRVLIKEIKTLILNPVAKKSKLKAEMFKISRETVQKVYQEAHSSIKENDVIDISVTYDGT